MEVKIKRVYEPADPADGYRILVDRLWPRGISKDKAEVEVWLKEVGPSNELRKWFNHEAANWPEFEKKYRAELAGNPAFEELRVLAAQQPRVTLVYSAHDETMNQAVVLQDLLREP
ncbi:MAG: DUF488 domain-containing protein [Homoserinimonas sp.]|nr:DUF488 domain-containing protein [Homoserinimonas sp.]